MKVIKTQLTDDDCEFNVTLSSMEAMGLVAMEHDAVMRFSAALLKSLDGLPQGVENETRNDKEIQ